MLDSENSKISKYPTSLLKYGLIPHEHQCSLFEPPYTKYRVIWSSSRWIKKFDGESCIDLPVYFDPDFDPTHALSRNRALSPDVGECWVLEKWISCREIAGATSESDWNSNPMYLGLGSYPKHGWYDFCTALSCNPGDANLDILIGAVEKRYSASENYQSILTDLDNKKKERVRIRKDRMENAMRPWGADAYVAFGGTQGSKTGTAIKSAEELGLPTRQGGTTMIPDEKRGFRYNVRL